MAASDQRLAATTPDYYLWAFPGSPIRIRLSLELVTRLQTRPTAENKGASWGGLLLGHVDGFTITLSDIHPLATGEADEIEPAIAQTSKTSGPDSVAGYYRFQHEPALSLNAADRALANVFFSGPHQVILLIQPADTGPANATFFFWDAGRLNGDFPFLEFPLDARLLAAAERQRVEAAHRRTIQLPPAVAEPAPPPPSKSARRFPWVTVAGALLAVCLVCGGIVVGARYFPRKSPTSQPSPVALTSTAAPAVPAPSLNLRAERQNGDLKLTWDRNNPAIAKTTFALLSIEDGDVSRIIPLEVSQLRGGSILYAALTDQVKVALTISTPGHDITESVLVLMPRNGPVRTIAAAPDSSPQPDAERDATRFQPTKRFIPPPAPERKSPAQDLAASAPPVLVPMANSAPPLDPVVLDRPSNAPPSAPASAAPPARVVARYDPPEPVGRVRPIFPASLRTTLRGPVAVEVTVSIDQNGKVVKAVPVVNSGVNQALVFAAVTAARQWRFQPARRDNQPSPSEMTLRFNFAP